MPPDNVDVSSQQSSTGEYSIAPQLLIEYHISDTVPPLHINFPLLEIASPTKDDDPESTEFVRDWQKTILIKSFRKIEKQLARRRILTDNHHLDELKTMLNYPNIDKKTFDEHFMLSIPMTNAGIPMEIYASQFLKTIRDFYIGNSPSGIIHIHLELTGLPYTLLEDAFSMSPSSPKHDADPTSTTTSSMPQVPSSSSIPPNESAATVSTHTTPVSTSPNATLITPDTLVLHLNLVGAARRHLRNAFSLKPRTTTLVDCNTESTPPNSQRIVTLVPSVVEACSDVTPLSTDHPALSEFGPPVNLVTDSTSNFPSIDEASLPSCTVVSTKTFGSAASTIFDPGDEVESSAVQISPALSQPSILVLSSLSTRASHGNTPVLDHHYISKDTGINDDQAPLFSDSCLVTNHFDGNYFTEALSHWFTLRRRPPDLRLFCIWSMQTAIHVHHFTRFSTASHFLGHFVRDLTASASLLLLSFQNRRISTPTLGFSISMHVKLSSSTS
jgi:hypothetical protein